MIIEEFKSGYSKRLIVKKAWDFGWHTYVTTGVLTQSGGLINDIWRPIVSSIKYQVSSALILGLATGTVAKIINKKFKDAKIIGVEIDPAMIAIGKKYFDLDKIPNLEIVIKDANKYKFEKVDLVLVDLYLGDTPPGFMYTDKFLKKIKRTCKIAVFNHLFYDSHKKAKAEELIKKLGKYFQNIKLQRVLTNIMIICE